MPERLPASVWPLLDGLNFAHVATLLPDGSPQVTPVWVDREGDLAVRINTAKGRVKHRNLVRDPRVAISVHDQDDPYSYVQVRGRAELVEEGAVAHIHALSHAYFGRDFPLAPGEERIIVRVEPERLDVHVRD